MAQTQEIFTLIGGRVHCHPGKYNPTSDAMWLASAANPRDNATVLDVGIGTGGAALCLMARLDNVKITGLDISDEMLTACHENAKLNNKNIELINADITTWKTDRTFDLVMTNPPYFRGTPAKHHAHHNADLIKWTQMALCRVRPRGIFCIISDAGTAAQIIAAMGTKCGDINIFPLMGARDTAERVIIRARLGTRGPCVIHRPISMNCDAVLRDGLTIDDALATLDQI